MDADTTLHPARIAMRRIFDRVRSVVPPSLSGDQYSRLTVPAFDAFVDAVRECERNDTPDTRAEVRRTGMALVEDWRFASRCWSRDRYISSRTKVAS